MSKIAFIASDKPLFRKAEMVIKKLGMDDDVDMYYARLNGAVRLARDLSDVSVDAIIARGAAAQLIPQAGIRIPVVNIAVSGQDLAGMLKNARLISGSTRPRVAFIAFSNVAPDLEDMSDLLGIDIRIYRLARQSDIDTVIGKAREEQCDVLIGGMRTRLLAEKRGLKCIAFQSSEISIETALREAEKISLGRKIEREQTEKFKVLIDHALEGIININRNNIVTVCNDAAGKLLKIPASACQGKDIRDVLNLPEIDECLGSGRQILAKVHRHHDSWLNINISPIMVEDVPVGACIALQDISRIQEAEARFRREVLAHRFVAKYDFADIRGASPQICETRRIATEFARADATTLVTGQSGTGKELFAQSIHNNSARRNGPFVAVNCAALPPSLLESELFGYVEGAFTGAMKKGRQGLFEMAHGGTLFLDEISEMDQYGQSRLLRVVQERQVMRLGDDKYIPIDIRIIAATNKNLVDECAAGRFRQDLYYRLKVLVLRIPPLDSRPGDAEILARGFVSQYNHKYQKNIDLTAGAYGALAKHAWPGNVRELSHFIERLVVSARGGEVGEEELASYFDEREPGAPPAALPPPAAGEAAAIAEAMSRTNCNVTVAAESLGLSRSTLYRKLQHYKIAGRKSYSQQI